MAVDTAVTRVSSAGFVLRQREPTDSKSPEKTKTKTVEASQEANAIVAGTCRELLL